MGLVLIDLTTMTGAAAPREEEVSVAAVAVAAAMARTVAAVAATVMPPHIIKVHRKARWEATIITSRCPRKIRTIRTATMLRLVPDSTTRQIHLVALIRVTAMKVRLRVPV